MASRFSLASVAALLLLPACREPAETPAASVETAPIDATAATEASAELPTDTAGPYRGNLMLSDGGLPTRSHVQVTCTVDKTGDRYRIRFSGGVPMVDLRTPTLDNLIFAAAPAAEAGVFHTTATAGSIEGVLLQTHPATLAIDVATKAGQLVFVGKKSE